jgi:hypothetical protein
MIKLFMCKVKHAGEGIAEARACVRQQLSTWTANAFTECEELPCILILLIFL